MENEAWFQPHPKVIREAFENEVVMIHLDTGNYFSMNATAGFIWEALAGGASTASVMTLLKARYEAPEATLRSALDRFVADLQEHNLVVPVAKISGNGAGVPPGPGGKLPFEMPVISAFTDMQDLLLLDPIHDVDETGWPVRPSDQAS